MHAAQPSNFFTWLSYQRAAPAHYGGPWMWQPRDPIGRWTDSNRPGESPAPQAAAAEPTAAQPAPQAETESPPKPRTYDELEAKHSDQEEELEERWAKLYRPIEKRRAREGRELERARDKEDDKSQTQRDRQDERRDARYERDDEKEYERLAKPLSKLEDVESFDETEYDRLEDEIGTQYEAYLAERQKERDEEWARITAERDQEDAEIQHARATEDARIEAQRQKEDEEFEAKKHASYEEMRERQEQESADFEPEEEDEDDFDYTGEPGPLPYQAPPPLTNFFTYLDYQARGPSVHYGKWITIGGHEEGEKKHAGGFPVYIDDNGVIQWGGPAGLTGRKVDEVKDWFDGQRKQGGLFEKRQGDRETGRPGDRQRPRQSYKEFSERALSHAPEDADEPAPQADEWQPSDKPAWQLTSSEWERELKESGDRRAYGKGNYGLKVAHRQEVEDALERGDEVPEKVLAEHEGVKRSKAKAADAGKPEPAKDKPNRQTVPAKAKRRDIYRPLEERYMEIIGHTDAIQEREPGLMPTIEDGLRYLRSAKDRLGGRISGKGYQEVKEKLEGFLEKAERIAKETVAPPAETGKDAAQPYARTDAPQNFFRWMEAQHYARTG